MYASLLVAAALISVQPAPTPTTPTEVLNIWRFNAALADDAIFHHVVELTGPVSEIYRDGMGGYIVRFDAAVSDPDWTGRIEIHCHFAGAARSALASVKPGVEVTIRGIPRQMRDHLTFLVDPNVRLDVKDCTVAAAAP